MCQEWMAQESVNCFSREMKFYKIITSFLVYWYPFSWTLGWLILDHWEGCSFAPWLAYPCTLGRLFIGPLEGFSLEYWLPVGPDSSLDTHVCLLICQ